MPKEQRFLADIIQLGLESLKGIFDDISNGITITDESSTILYVNPGFTKITGYSREEALGNNPGMLHSGMQDKAYFEEMWRSITQDGRWSGEIWNRHKQGHLIPEFLTITQIKSDQHIYYIAVFSDISVLIEENKKKLNLALTDPLTRLPNRSFLNEAFNYMTNQYIRDQHGKKESEYQIALLFIDVSKFKAINDQYGHLAGDNVLRFIASSIKSSLRDIDVAIRYGGDEFIILLNKITHNDKISHICKRIHTLLEQPLSYEDHDHYVKINIGVALYPEQANTLTDMIECADEAMYHAKKHDQFICFSEK
ncbi:MAG: diguanylate cyclase [Legionellaceae bacterium]|nr:diguanylate cyclase [Legionellaceae bacterium]